METSKKVICALFATTISMCCFSQLNLGLQSTTNAAVNAATATNAISKISNTATANTNRVVNSTISKSQQLQTTAGTLAGNTSAQVGNMANSAGNTNIAGNLSSTVSSQSASAGSTLLLESSSTANSNVGIGDIAKKTSNLIQPVKGNVSRIKKDVTKSAGTAVDLGKQTTSQTGEVNLSSGISTNANIKVEKK